LKAVFGLATAQPRGGPGPSGCLWTRVPGAPQRSVTVVRTGYR